MNSSSAAPPEQSSGIALFQNKALRQFVKFCIVGSLNVVIDAGVSYVLHYHFHLPIEQAKVVSFIVAVSNSFFWNSRWTFRALDPERQHKQYLMFVCVNIVGLALNLTAVKTLSYLWFGGGHLVNRELSKTQFVIATLLPAVVVATWNFTANKKWTFKA